MKGQRLRYGSAIAALVLGSCVMYLVPLVPQITLDVALADEPGELPGLTRRVVGLFGGQEVVREFLASRLWVACALIVGLTALAGLLTYVRGRGAAKASEAIASANPSNRWPEASPICPPSHASSPNASSTSAPRST